MLIGEKIKTLRREMKITQEQLAEYLDISSQAVSKWETGISSPDIDMLPRLAIFFHTSIDNLLNFDRQRIDEEVDKLVKESIPLREEPEKAEAFYRDALKKYPNNEVLLNCLMMVIPDNRISEKIEIGERLLDCTTDDEIRLDVLRILALSCHYRGEHGMAEHYLAKLPELYFLKTEIAAAIRTGEAQQIEIEKTENICIWTLGAMLRLRENRETNSEEKVKMKDLLRTFLELFCHDQTFHNRAERIAKDLLEKELTFK